MKLYLAGATASDRRWVDGARTQVKNWDPSFRIIDPFDFGFTDGVTPTPIIVNTCLSEVENANGLLIDLRVVSTGASIEMFSAARAGIPVVGFIGAFKAPVSQFAKLYCDRIEVGVHDAIEELCKLVKQAQS